jgi:flagellar protein FliL
MADESTESETKPRRPSPLGVVLQVANLLATVAILAVVAIKLPLDDDEPPAPPAKTSDAADTADAKPAHLLALDDFVVRLRNPEKERYLRMSVRIELASPVDLDRAASQVPMVRDLVLAFLSDKTFEDLRGARGLEECKAGLQERLEPVFGTALRALYITNFVIQ